MVSNIWTKTLFSGNSEPITSNGSPQLIIRHRVITSGKERFSSKNHPIGRLREAVSGKELKGEKEE